MCSRRRLVCALPQLLFYLLVIVVCFPVLLQQAQVVRHVPPFSKARSSGPAMQVATLYFLEFHSQLQRVERIGTFHNNSNLNTTVPLSPSSHQTLTMATDGHHLKKLPSSAFLFRPQSMVQHVLRLSRIANILNSRRTASI